MFVLQVPWSLLSWLGNLLEKTRGRRALEAASRLGLWRPTFLQLCFLCVAERKRDEIGQAQGGGPGTQQTLHFLQIAGEIDTVLNSLGVAWSSLGTVR